MALRNTTRRWGALSQLLHWLIVVLIIVQVTLASMADDLPAGVRKIALLARHKSVGITILMLAILRLAWRWTNPTPQLPQTLKPYEQTLARVTHAMLYVLLFAMPLSGWMMSSARGFPVSWFGFLPCPTWCRRTSRCTRRCSPPTKRWRGFWARSWRCTCWQRSSITSGCAMTRCGACCPAAQARDPNHDFLTCSAERTVARGAVRRGACRRTTGQRALPARPAQEHPGIRLRAGRRAEQGALPPLHGGFRVRRRDGRPEPPRGDRRHELARQR